MRRAALKERDQLTRQKAVMRARSKRSPDRWDLLLSKRAQILALYHYRYTQVNYKKEY